MANRAATFGGLAPSRYALQLQGSDRNGRWSPQTLEVEIEVLPACWHTWWAALLGALLLVAAALFDSDVKEGKDKLSAFMNQLIQRMEMGEKLELEVRGFASPRSYSDYNKILRER